MRIDLKALARVGAQARLAELLVEIAAIQRAFPGIGSKQRGRPREVSTLAAANPNVKRRRRKPMTMAERKEVSKRMKKYWAARRKKGVFV